MHPADEKACVRSEFRCLFAESVASSGIPALWPWFWSMNNVGYLGEHLKHLQIPQLLFYHVLSALICL